MAAISMDGIPITALPADAENINYDNSNSGLSANNAQEAIDELNSGLTNVQDDVKLNTQDLTTLSRTKNILPVTLENFKLSSTDGVWSGNQYTFRGITFTVNTDTDNNVTSIVANGTSTADFALIKITNFSIPAGSYKLSGATNGSMASYRVSINGDIIVLDGETDLSFSEYTVCTMECTIRSSGYVAENVIFKPMIRLSSEADATFAPFIPSINNKVNKNIEDINQLRSGLTNILKYKTFNEVATDTANHFYSTGIRCDQYVCLGGCTPYNPNFMIQLSNIEITSNGFIRYKLYDVATNQIVSDNAAYMVELVFVDKSMLSELVITP